MLLGIIAGLTTCALWGLTFVAPRAITPFTAWDLTIARYGIFGLACLLLMADRRFRPVGIAPSRLLIGLLLGGVGYVGYFVSAAFAVQLAGAAIPPVIIGTMPVFLAIIANSRDRSAPWQTLALPLVLIAIGVAIVNVAAISAADVADMAAIMLGVLTSSAALAIWIAYGLANAAIMRAADAPDGLQWTGVQGMGAATAGIFRSGGYGIRFGNLALCRMGVGDGAGRLVVRDVVLGGCVSSLAAGTLRSAHRRRNDFRSRIWLYVRGPVSISGRGNRSNFAIGRRLLRHRSFQ